MTWMQTENGPDSKKTAQSVRLKEASCSILDDQIILKDLFRDNHARAALTMQQS